mgnify:FL=1
MAEALKAPVILDDEDQQTTPAVASETLSETTVAEDVQAGTVAIPSGQTEAEKAAELAGGTPRIDIQPVKLKPRPQSSTTGVDIPVEKKTIIKDAPLVGDISVPVPTGIVFKSLQEETQESVEKFEKPLDTYQGTIEKLESGETVVINGQTYSGPMAAKLARTPAIMKKMQIGIAIENSLKKKQQSETVTDTTIAFTTPTGEIDVSYLDDNVQDTARIYAEGRKALDDALRPLIKTDRPDIDVAVRQYFIDDFATGDMLQNLATRLAETGRAIPTLPTYGADATASFGEAISRAFDMETSIGDEWAALAPKREAQTKDALRSISEFLPAPTAAMALNEAVRQRAKKDLDDGLMTQAVYDDFIYEETVTGEKFLREFISDEAAYAAIEESFNQMSGVESVMVLAAEGFLGGGILSKTKNTHSLQYLKRVQDRAASLGIAADTPLRRLPALIRQSDESFKLDKQLFDLGLYNKGFKTEVSESKTRINDLAVEMRQVALGERGREGLAYKRLESERDNLIKTVNRNFARRTLSPYMREIVGDETYLAIGATIGRTYLEGTLGMDSDMGEMMGFVGGLLAKKPAYATTGAVVGGGRKLIGLGQGLSKITPDGILDPLDVTFSFLTRSDMTVSDYNKLYFEPKNGRRMNLEERKQVKGAFKQLEKMDPDRRDDLLDQIREQRAILNEVLDIFPEGPRRERMAQMLEGSFAEMTGLPQAIAAYQTATQTMTMKGFRKNGLTGALEAAVAMDEKRMRTQTILQEFEKEVAEFGDPQGTQAVTDLIENTKLSLERTSKMINEEFIKLDNNLNAMVDEAVSDLTTPLSETFLQEYVDAQEVLQKRLNRGETAELSGTVDRIERVRGALQATNASLLKRFDTIRAVRDEKQLHSSSLASAVEAVLMQRYGYLHEQMDVAYDGFRKFMADRDEVPRVDISPAVEEMLRLANADDKNITTFFGPSATFFSGFLGRQSRTMFEKMVKRTMDDLPAGEVDEMFTALVENGVNPEDLQDLLDNDPVGFGLMLHQSGNINVFANATVEEAEEFRRAFRDYGHKTSNKAVSREFKGFEKIIDKAMKDSDEVGYAELKKARGIYQKLNDPLREGSPLNKLMKSKVGDKVDADSGVYAAMYKGITPYALVKRMGTSIATAMKGGRDRPVAIEALREEIGALAQLLGTESNGVMRIDLRTEEGKQALELMQEITEAVVYDAWAADFLKRKPKAGTRIGDPRGLGFSQSIQENLNGLSKEFNVDIIGEDGVETTAVIADLVGLVAEEQDIAKLIQRGGRFYDKGLKAVSKIKREIKNVASLASERGKQEQVAQQKLLSVTNLKDSGSFYQEYIRGFGDVDILRENFRKAMKVDPAMQDVDVEKLFDVAMYNIAYQGILQVGGYGPKAMLATQRAKAKGLLGETVVTSGFSNIIGAIAEFENDDVIRNLQKIMPKEQIKSIENILRYTANQETIRIAGDAIANGMSVNEAISRAYNIARGMVSPAYIATETTVRLAQKNSSDALLLALQNKDAAKIMEKMLATPKLMTKAELDTFDTLLINFVATDVVRKGQQEATEAYFKQYEEQTNENEQ